VTVILMTPKGERTATVNRSFHSFVDIELPEGVEEAEVDVYSCFRDAGGHVPSGCGPALIQGAVRKIESALSMVGLQAAEPAAGAAPAVAVPAATAPVADAAPVDLASADTTPAITGSTDAAPVAAVAPVDAAPAVDTAPAEVAPVADATPANAAPVADPAPAQAAPAADAPAVADAAPLADAAPANAAPAAG
jgi:hypothetical protein